MTIDQRLDRVVEVLAEVANGQRETKDMIDLLTRRQDGLTTSVLLLHEDIKSHSQDIKNHSQDLQVHFENFKQVMAGIDGLLRIVHSHEERLSRIEGEGSV